MSQLVSVTSVPGLTDNVPVNRSLTNSSGCGVFSPSHSPSHGLKNRTNALCSPLHLSLQNAEYRFLSSLNVLNVVQSGIMFVGISLGVMACTAGVAKVRRKHY
jgi:hypothetical protein